MPIYEYQCDACGVRFEQIQKFSDPPLDTCTSCGAGPVRRLLSSPAIQFKGAGWYVTDYARPAAGKDSSTPEGSAGRSADKASSTKPDSKSDSKSDSKTPAAPAASTPGKAD